ncbi:MAG TPA: PQQ-dependent sugar dehydrogenase, partial [Beijerinckiaceae bacterium]|nr:PQQ-dependent sugar dehydrogenase [Beijerinckiaceae bacterium]
MLARAAIVLTLLAGPLLASSAAQTRLKTDKAEILVETVAGGLNHPWGFAFLPDAGMLVTERPGRLRLVAADGKVSPALAGVPSVYAQGQGGLLDVALAPDFAASRLVYLSFAEAGEGGASTAVARGRLNEAATALEDTKVIFRQQPKVTGGNHFGSRLAFGRDGKLFVTTGERFKFDPAQDVSNHIGKILRINPDGSVPQDNPFAGRAGARPEIWSYGHRNIQSAAIHPATGALWEVEHGPRGGDELILAEPGRNYGWPLVRWGRHYDGRDIPDPPTRPDLAGSVHEWTPVIGPSGMAFYTGEAFPAWRGDVLIGGLVSQGLVRVSLEGTRMTG